MTLSILCPPALIYLVFSITQIIIDITKGAYNVALVKILVSTIFTILLNYLCSIGLSIISWFIIFIPFILMTVIVTLILVMFGLNPLTGKKYNIKIDNSDTAKSSEQNYINLDTTKSSKDINNPLDIQNFKIPSQKDIDRPTTNEITAGSTDSTTDATDADAKILRAEKEAEIAKQIASGIPVSDDEDNDANNFLAVTQKEQTRKDNLNKWQKNP